MPSITRLATVAATAVTIGVSVASPAQAAADPAVTGCSFTPLYATNTGGQLSGVKYYYSRNTELTVSGGDGNAWQVTVDRNGDQGWMEAECVLFLA